MAQTLGEYIFSKATNKRPSEGSSGSKSSTLTESFMGGGFGNVINVPTDTLTGFLYNKFKKQNESNQSFEEQLKKSFKLLSNRTSSIKKEQYKQIKIINKLVDHQKEVAESLSLINTKVKERNRLEQEYYQEIIDDLIEAANIQRQESSEPNEIVSDDEPSSSTPSSTPTPPKAAAGGTTKITQPTQKTNKTDKQKQIDFAEVIQSPLKAAGISAISHLGSFISAVGALGGFFKGYVRDVAKPFAISLGVGESLINSLLGGPVQAAERRGKQYQKEFGKTWASFLQDDGFVSLYIQRTIGEEIDTQNPPGYVPAKWDEDPEFVALVNAFAQEWNLNANGLLALMASESGIDPAKFNSIGCVGLIQFCPGGGLGGTGKTAQELSKMTRSQQWPYVTNYWIKSGLEKGMTAGDLYGLTHVPNWYKTAVKGKPIGSAARMDAVTADTSDGGAYYDNKRLDFNKDGRITVGDYDQEVARVGKGFGIDYKPHKFEAGGGFEVDQKLLNTKMPFMLEGPNVGFPVKIGGTKIIAHGKEIFVPFDSGYQVYPVENRRYSIFRDPQSVARRWQEISTDKNVSIDNMAQGGGVMDARHAHVKRLRDKQRPLGTKAKIKGKEVYWAGPNFGWQRLNSGGRSYTMESLNTPSVQLKFIQDKSPSVFSGKPKSIITPPPALTETDILMKEYNALIKEGKHSEAKELGIKIWNKTYRKTAIGIERIPSSPVPKASAEKLAPTVASYTQPRLIINDMRTLENAPNFSSSQQQMQTDQIITRAYLDPHMLRTDLIMRRSK